MRIYQLRRKQEEMEEEILRWEERIAAAVATRWRRTWRNGRPISCWEMSVLLIQKRRCHVIRVVTEKMSYKALDVKAYKHQEKYQEFVCFLLSFRALFSLWILWDAFLISALECLYMYLLASESRFGILWAWDLVFRITIHHHFRVMFIIFFNHEFPCISLLLWTLSGSTCFTSYHTFMFFFWLKASHFYVSVMIFLCVYLSLESYLLP